MTNWRNVPFHTLFHRLQKRTGFPDEELLSVYRDYGVIRKGDRDDNFNRPGDLSDYQLVERGDLVLNKMKTWQGSLGISPHRGIVSPAYFVYKPVSQNDERFLHYALRCRDAIDYYASHSTGIRINQWDLSPEWLDVMPVALPDLETQRRIANYLDKEISEMDALIGEFEGLAKNLSARRARLVNRIIEKHAKTQEESGDPWDRHSFKLLVESHFAGDWGSDIGHDEVDLPCVRVADFNRATSSLAEEIPTIRSYSESTYEKKHLVRDDLLVEKSGGGEKTPVGSVVLYEGDSSALCANFIEVIRLRRGQVPRFWVHMFRANFVAGETFRFVKQTTGIQNLDMQMFLDQKFVVPPSGKQREIADELDREFERMDALIEESTQLIENLKARKTALITEVVTGRKEV